MFLELTIVCSNLFDLDLNCLILLFRLCIVWSCCLCLVIGECGCVVYELTVAVFFGFVSHLLFCDLICCLLFGLVSV